MQDFPFMSDEAQKVKYKRNPILKQKDKEIFSVKEAAEAVGVTKEALYYRIWNDLLKVRVIGGHYFIKREEVLKLEKYYAQKK